MTDLARIVADVRRRAAVRRARQPLERLKEIVREDSWRRERFLVALGRDPFAIVPTIRRRAPWSNVRLDEPAGRSVVPTREPSPGPRWFAFVQSCQKGGAAALAVATELDHFGGTLDDLRAVEFTGLSRIRDDFVVDEAMVWETCLYGADAVVLRASILDDVELPWLRSIAKELGLAVVLEAHDEREVDRALALEPEILLVSARDPSTGDVRGDALGRLRPRIPAAVKIGVSGGLARVEQLSSARAAGASVAFVGDALLAATDPGAVLAEWRESQR